MNPASKHPDFAVIANPQAREGETELWSSFRSGSRDALNMIFEKYARMLYTYGRNITRDQSLVSDCIQDVFVELWIKREAVAPQVTSIQYYLFKSLRRRIGRRLASERLVSGLIPDDYCATTETNIESNLVRDQVIEDRSLRLKTSIGTLSERQREAVYLRFYRNMSYEEVASVMETDVKAVYNLVARSIYSLRKFFNTHPIEC